MYEQDEYLYRISQGTMQEATGMTWRRIDEETGQPSPLEIVANTDRDWAVGSALSVDADTFFQDKLVQSHTHTDLLKNQLESREQMKNAHLARVEEDIGYCKYRLWSMDLLYVDRALERSRNTFSQAILNLQREKRAIEETAWRDQSRVLTDFFEAWGSYRADLWTYSVLNPKNG